MVIIMVKYLCFECKNGNDECEYPCVYIDPIGELNNADHIKCYMNNAIWIRERCNCCGHDI